MSEDNNNLTLPQQLILIQAKTELEKASREQLLELCLELMKDCYQAQNQARLLMAKYMDKTSPLPGFNGEDYIKSQLKY